MQCMMTYVSIVVLFCGFASHVSQAEEPEPAKDAPMYYVSPLLGYGQGTTPGSGGYFSYAVRAGARLERRPENYTTLGLNVGGISKSETVSGVSVNSSVTAIMLDFMGNRLWGSGLRFGARGGIGLVSADYSYRGVTYHGSSSGFLYGPALGYEFAISESLSFDFDASIVNLSGGTLQVDRLGSAAYPSSSAVILLGGVSFHF